MYKHTSEMIGHFLRIAILDGMDSDPGLEWESCLSSTHSGIPVQTVCYKQEFVISEQFAMRYCSTWLRSLLRYI